MKFEREKKKKKNLLLSTRNKLQLTTSYKGLKLDGAILWDIKLWIIRSKFPPPSNVLWYGYEMFSRFVPPPNVLVVWGGRCEYQPKLSHGVSFGEKGERNVLMWHFVFCYVFLGILFSAYKVCNWKRRSSENNDRNDKFLCHLIFLKPFKSWKLLDIRFHPWKLKHKTLLCTITQFFIIMFTTGYHHRFRILLGKNKYTAY